MIRRISLKNFMSHKNTVIELADGVTVISGPNNVGKSAVVEAIRCVCENPPAAFVIRHGAKKAVVEIELATGDVIRWERRHRSFLYRIRSADGDEQVYSKNRGVPEDVRRLLRMGPVDTGDGKLDVHLAHQKMPMFLLDESGSRIAAFFAASTEAEYLVKMRQALKDKTRYYREKKSELERDIEELRASLEVYEPLDEIERQLAVCSARYREIVERDLKIEELHRLIDDLERQREKIDRCSQQVDLLGRLNSPPDARNTDDLARIIRSLEEAVTGLKNLSLEIKYLESAAPPPELKATFPLGELLQEMAELKRRRDLAKAIINVADGVYNPPELRDVFVLNSLCAEMEQLVKRRALLEKTLNVCATVQDLPQLKEVDGLCKTINEVLALSNLEKNLESFLATLNLLDDPPDVHEVESLSEMINELESLTKKVENLERFLSECEKKLLSKKEEIKGYLEKIRVCPLCRQVIDPEQFLQGTHHE